MTDLRTKINEYLFYEFGLDCEETTEPVISDNFPFELHYLGSIEIEAGKTEVFEFSDKNAEFFALANGHLDFHSKAGIDFENLRLQMLGAQWIGRHEPIDLNTSRIGDDSVPSTLIRKATIEKLAAQTFGEQTKFEVLEGLFLRQTGKYLALFRSQHSPKATIIGDGLELQEVEFENASSWRRLSIGIGKMLSLGKLE